MKMPDIISSEMLAPCGINCCVCSRHTTIKKRSVPCEGCLAGDSGKTERCRNCSIKSCAESKGFERCFECTDFPCRQIKNIDKSYRKRYSISLVENGRAAEKTGIGLFLEQERIKWTCPDCGGAFSLHDGFCSECGGLFPEAEKN